MFDIGFSELFLIAIVALVVLGPERLPKAARFAGLWVRRARNQWASVKSELERELAADEFKRTLHDTQAALREIDDDVRAADADARREFDAMRDGLSGPSAGKARKAAVAAAASAGTTDSSANDGDDDAADALMTGPPVPSETPPAAKSTDAAAPSHDDRLRLPTNDDDGALVRDDQLGAGPVDDDIDSGNGDTNDAHRADDAPMPRGGDDARRT